MGEQENFSHYLDIPDLEVTDKSIYYSKPATVFAAVAASIFTIVGVLGKWDSSLGFSEITSWNGKGIRLVRLHIGLP